MDKQRLQSRPCDPVLNMYMAPNSGYHLSQLDFEIVLSTDNGSGRLQTILKKECNKVDDDNYTYYPDTDMLGRGRYSAKLIVRIPDQASPKGYRRLSDEVETDLIID